MPSGLPFSYPIMLLIICPLCFLAGFVDSIAGGGGIISIPAYLLAGLPVHMTYGTNKFAMAIGTSVSAGRFLKSGKVNLPAALVAAPAALIGAYGGTRLALALDERYLKTALMVVLPLLAIFLFTRRSFGLETATAAAGPVRGMLPLSFLAGLVVGAYDGFIGPGTGTFLILIFTGLMHFDLIKASGSAKIVNLASNIASLITYFFNGKVIFAIGIPAAACTILGNLIGSHLAINKGARIIRPIIITVLVLLFLRFLYDVLPFF
jgi:uncharacterized membrane protein YfcA